MSDHESQPNGTEMQYGLPTPRDENNELVPDEHTYEWGGQEVTIMLIPPTLDQFERYTEIGREEDNLKQLKEIVDRHLLKPDVEAKNMTMREVNCYVEGIVDYGTSGGGPDMDKVREKRDELQEQRRGN